VPKMQFPFGVCIAGNGTTTAPNTTSYAQTISFLTRWHNRPATWTAAALYFDSINSNVGCRSRHTDTKTCTIPKIWNRGPTAGKL